MSRIGKNPVTILDDVTVKIEEKSEMGGQRVVVTGPLGELKQDMRKNVTCKVEDNQVIFEREDETKFSKSLHGLYRMLVYNMIFGVKNGYEKKLEIIGIGYRAQLKGRDLELQLGATHPHLVKAPEGITFEVDNKVNLTVKGIDKQLVGETAAKIRSFAKPEPYKGKGIRYKGEYVRRKPGKAAKAAEGAE